MLSKDGGEDSYESSYDFSLEFKPISYYVNNHEEMVRQMFKVVGISFIKSIMPKSLNNMPILQLQQACVSELNNLYPADIKQILSGNKMPSSPIRKSMMLDLITSSDISDDFNSIHSNMTNANLSKSSSRTPSPHFVVSNKNVSQISDTRSYARTNRLLHSSKKSQKSDKWKSNTRRSSTRSLLGEAKKGTIFKKDTTLDSPKPKSLDGRNKSLSTKFSSDHHNTHDTKSVKKVLPKPQTSENLNLVELKLREKAIQAMMAHKKQT